MSATDPKPSTSGALFGADEKQALREMAPLLEAIGEPGMAQDARELGCSGWEQIGSFRPRRFYVEPHCGNCGRPASEHP